MKERLQEHRTERKKANRKAFYQIALVWLGLGAIAFTMHIWIPASIKFFESLGW